MEKHAAKRHVALIENCVMTMAGFRQLLHSSMEVPCQLHAFRDSNRWFTNATHPCYDLAVYSVADSRDSRQQFLHFFTHLAQVNPETVRVLLAENEHQARLIPDLSPVPLHGVLVKTMATDELLFQINALLARRFQPETLVTTSAVGLSPTERKLLYYIGKGLSIPEIAVQMKRNTKTIRTHKFNAMAKLGVNSDIGLLYAADILRYLPVSASSVSPL